MKSIIAAVVCLMMWGTPLSAQWEKVPDKPNLSAPAPKTRDGMVDLSGVWRVDGAPLPAGIPAVESITGIAPPAQFIDITAGMKPEEVPFLPWSAALFGQHVQSEGRADPIAHCQPTGVPAIAEVPIPYKIVQTPRLILILYEEGTVFRQIFLDSRRPVQDAQPRWMGYSSGKWEGDTLIVDTVGFTDRSWLDRLGHPHSEAMRVIERFRRRDTGHLEIEVTIDDPKAYSKPIKYTHKATLLPGEDLMEYFCTENEKDVQQFK